MIFRVDWSRLMDIGKQVHGFLTTVKLDDKFDRQVQMSLKPESSHILEVYSYLEAVYRVFVVISLSMLDRYWAAV